ncbi:hypothetical protein AAFN85_01585 [Mucilaginibacter sp. CAU 1740]
MLRICAKKVQESTQQSHCAEKGKYVTVMKLNFGFNNIHLI